MAKTNTYTCLNCGMPFEARVADRNRGWAKFHNKSCKASYQERRTGQHAAYTARTNTTTTQQGEAFEAGIDCMEAGWDGHKNAY